MGFENQEATLPAIIRTISRTVLSVIGAELAKHALLLCAACAFVFVLSRTYGLDLSAGFF
ncbi:hypothetical protein [Bradyrhizobium canariense]|jgi:hypothetical protein|uniref:Uncharacterized protein n=1 Tax=Bradyrhizobium canariense TaxID=255045 RepID=A0A1X3FWC8_9BRAD|nr:hypothetical protein [Bradyrhizobium canariense]OSI68339.1 hypothetical protein BSZ22_21960 [Bradyrhizobium canariense]OSI70987.1 hypothetical protein BSZ21_10290 [Bradyrhizobium canariense]OSI81417.1 hypothetical protein BSZ23_06590 [Bradyrhizobium canariense]OSI95085.1 hypothetical protein BSZ25_05275 [Bradyrhizobium canariense]OSI95361.1 hypothetical protein BSZ24_07720 [Bradyrhizobium canariense]